MQNVLPKEDVSLFAERRAASQTLDTVSNGQPCVAAAFSDQVAKQEKSSFHAASSDDGQARCSQARSLTATSVANTRVPWFFSQPTLPCTSGFLTA